MNINSLDPNVEELDLSNKNLTELPDLSKFIFLREKVKNLKKKFKVIIKK